MRYSAAIAVLAAVMAGGCGRAPAPPVVDPVVPLGYVARLEIVHDGKLLHFGPFVGYYFKPTRPNDFSRVDMVCYNTDQFYTRDRPAAARLFTGDAVLAVLPDTGLRLPDTERINPVFFTDAPAAWLATRPEPADEYAHFHSAYNAVGPVRVGYWIRHRAVAAFTYDMGGRVGPGSLLYHAVTPGVDQAFGHMVEFDRGPRPGG